MSTTVAKAIQLARKHVGNGAVMDSSARVCLADAVALFDAGKLADARQRAVDSLRFSVGEFHEDFIAAGKVPAIVARKGGV